jgi:hypothetical protein
MGWKEAEQSTPSGKPREKFQDGLHYCRVERTLHRDKERNPLQTKKGDPSFRIVWRSCGMEGLDSFALHEGAQWKLARVLARLGHDLDELDGRGLAVTDFTDEDVCRELLVGRWSWCRVTRNGPYADFDPIKEPEVLKHLSNADAAKESAGRPTLRGEDERNPDDIPF